MADSLSGNCSHDSGTSRDNHHSIHGATGTPEDDVELGSISDQELGQGTENIDNKHSLKVLSWNICGLEKHTRNSEIIGFLNEFDIIHICETWGKECGEFNDLLKSYIHFDYIRNIKPTAIRNSGGISVFIKSS